MSDVRPIEIFKVGTHRAMSGTELSFAEIELDKMAKVYDPSVHEAPIVLGHPTHDAPAYGWIEGLDYSEGTLSARPKQLDPGFVDMVRRGAYKRVSASFYTPDAPSNPSPGAYYLRHVGFLGAMPPAVKGLKPVSFASDEIGIVEFDEFDASALLGVPHMESPPSTPSMEDKMTEEIKDKSADFAAKELEFAERLAAIEVREAKIRDIENELALKKQQEEREHAVAYCEGLVQSGKVRVAHKPALVDLLLHLGNPGSVNFAEDFKPVDALKSLLDEIKPVVEFGELAPEPNTNQPMATIDFTVPPGYSLDSDRMALHVKAMAHMQQNPGTDYMTSILRVSKG